MKYGFRKNIENTNTFTDQLSKRELSEVWEDKTSFIFSHKILIKIQINTISENGEED